MNEDSILDSTKKVLGIDANYDAFDPDILMHINSVFATLTQLGVGPEEGFAITGKEETWSSFLNDDPKINSVKTYVYLKVRIFFDPPGTSYLIDSLKRQADEFEWRLNVAREEQIYEDPFEEELEA